MQYLSEAERLDIDKVINKKLLTSSRIYQMLLDSFLPTPRCLALEYAEVVEIVAGEGSKIVKAPVKDLKLPKGTTIGGMIRDGVGMLVGGETRIRPGDHLVIFCLTGSLSKIEKFFV